MHSPSALDRTFRALADGTRRSMIHALARGEARSAGELGSRFSSAQPTISRHLKVLEEAGFSLADIVRVTHYVTDIRYSDELYPVVAEFLGDVRPASTLVGVSALATPQMKVEIEVTAKRRERP